MCKREETEEIKGAEQEREVVSGGEKDNKEEQMRSSKMKDKR